MLHVPPHPDPPPPSGESGGVALRWVAAAAVVLGALLVTALFVSTSGSGDDPTVSRDTGEEATNAVPAPLDPPTWTSVAPYGDGSPWNTPLADDAPTHPRSDALMQRIDEPLTSDTSQYTLPVYEVDGDTPTTEVEIEHVFSEVVDDGTALRRQQAPTVEVPLPDGAEPAIGGDAQLVVVDTETGDEWGFWQLRVEDGQHRATNGYRYNVGWSGVPPEGFGSRGAGLPYLAGLIRPADIERGRIDHAIAFAYPTPSPDHVYPATKSDGPGDPDADLPEGARLRLDPSLDADDLRELGLDEAGIVIARAMQEYGLILIDIAGRPKIYAEYEDTAGWDDRLTEDTVAAIPIERFEVLDWEGGHEPPLARPTAPDTVPAGGDVELDGLASLAPRSQLVEHEWTDVDGRVIGDEATIRYPTDDLEPGTHRFALRVADEEGRWSARHHVDVRVEVVDGPHVTGTREATGRDVTSLELPDWRSADEDEWLVAAVALRRTLPDDGVAVEAVTGAGREWERALHETDERGRVALEVWVAPPGPSTDEAVELTTTRSTNLAVRGLQVAGAGDLATRSVEASPDPPTDEATTTVSDAEGLVLGLHAGRTEDVTPEGEGAGDVRSTIVEDEGGSVRVTTFTTSTDGDGDAELRASTRSPVEWVLGGLAFAPEDDG